MGHASLAMRTARCVTRMSLLSSRTCAARSWFFAAIVAIFVSSDGGELSFPENRLYNSDGLGRFSHWVNNRWGFYSDFEGGEWIPLRFHFSSQQDRVVSGILGHGWWVPCLESAVIQVDEANLRVLLLGGKSVYLRRTSENSFESRCGNWVGDLSGDEFVVSGRGWLLDYKDGKLRSSTTPAGSQLVWVYQGREVSELLSNGETVVKVMRGNEGEVSGIQLQGGGVVDMGWGKFPIVSQIHGLGQVITGETSYVNRIVSTGGPQEDYSDSYEVGIKSDDRGGLSYSFDFGGGVEVAEWLPDGSIVSDLRGTYSYERDESSGYRITHNDYSGRESSYSWDARKFEERKQLRGGIVGVTRRVGVEGGAFLRTREVSYEDKSGNVTSSMVSLNEDGSPLRVMTSVNEGAPLVFDSKYAPKPLNVKFSEEGGYSVDFDRGNGSFLEILVRDGKFIRN